MESEEPPATNLSGIIARSRSRYKSNRRDQVPTSEKPPPRISSEQLGQDTQHQCGPDGRQERRLDKATADARHYSTEDSPPQISQGLTEGKHSRSSVSPASKLSTNSPHASSDRWPRNTAGQEANQYRTRSHEVEQRGSRLDGQAGRKAWQNQTTPWHTEQQHGMSGERIFTRKLSSEFKVPQDEQAIVRPEKSRFRGDEAADPAAKSRTHPIQAPPMPPNRHQFREKATIQSERVESRAAPPKSSTLQKRSLTHRRKGSNVREELKRTISAPMAVEPAEASIKPAFDAPVSAVNAGERKVRVHFDTSVLSIPVMPLTTPLDIIREAGTQLSTALDANTNVLLESFKQLGLERPLRRYERIRDIMNSWDHDSQNSLNIVPSPTGGRDDDLDLNSVLQSQPGDTSVHIYHSNAPGTWDKRWVTLRSDGQVLITKKDGKETSNICHVSDFDIYVPIKKQMAKKIKPPKKYCFAVKSQQKSAMFLSTENFVHFFAAGDRELAMAWYKAVQEWRSWYLVNVMGEGQKHTVTSRLREPPANLQSPAKIHQGRPSLDQESLPLNGGFAQTPLISQPSPIKSFPTRSQGPPPVSFPTRLTKNINTGVATTRNNTNHRPSIIQTQPLVQAEAEPFAAQGLLGRTYTQRQQAVAKENREKAHDYGLPEYHNEDASRGEGDSVQRRSSQQCTQKPLIDLTPKYQEPPQHRKKGKGVMPDRIRAGALIEAATNREPGVTDPVDLVGVQRSRTIRSQHPNVRQASASPEKQGPAFTGGLLSSAQKHGQDGTGTGHGVKTGDRMATEPLLNMTTEGPWAKGSLLDRVHSGESGQGPVIDRGKRHEVDAPVGEGF